MSGAQLAPAQHPAPQWSTAELQVTQCSSKRTAVRVQCRGHGLASYRCGAVQAGHCQAQGCASIPGRFQTDCIEREPVRRESNTVDHTADPTAATSATATPISPECSLLQALDPTSPPARRRRDHHLRHHHHHCNHQHHYHHNHPPPRASCLPGDAAAAHQNICFAFLNCRITSQ